MTDPAGFEPAIPGLEGRCFILAKPRAPPLLLLTLFAIPSMHLQLKEKFYQKKR